MTLVRVRHPSAPYPLPSAADPDGSGHDITQALAAVGDDRARLDQLFPLVYAELKRIAHRALARSSGATLCTTALVHEAYAKLAGHEHIDLQCRKHFFALCARAMRQIVIDHARRRLADKRGSGQAAAELFDHNAIDFSRPDSLVALDAALTELERQDTRLVELLHYRLFAGLELPAIAELYGLTLRQIQRDWQRARLWLYQALLPDNPAGS